MTKENKKAKGVGKAVKGFGSALLGLGSESLVRALRKEISKRGKNYNTPGEKSRAKKGERNRITSVIKKMYKKPKKGSPHKK